MFHHQCGTRTASGRRSIAAYIETTLQRISAQLTAAVIRGQQAGDFNADLDENDVGTFLLCIVQGLRVLGKVEISEKKLAGIVDMTLRALL